jgi:hypothetical protein
MVALLELFAFSHRELTIVLSLVYGVDDIINTYDMF